VYNTRFATGTGGATSVFGADGAFAGGGITLTSTSLPNGYGLVQSGSVWTASKAGSPDLFTITFNSTTSQYEFKLLADKPPVPVSVDIDSALSGATALRYDQNGNLTTATDVYKIVLPQSGNSPYVITATAMDGTQATTLRVGSGTIGVGGDAVLQQTGGADDKFILTFDNVTKQASKLESASITVNQFNKNNDIFAVIVTGTVITNNVPSTVTATYYSNAVSGVTLTPVGTDTVVNFSIAQFSEITSIVLDSVQSNLKVVDFDVNFKVQESVGDYEYNFLSTVKDGDGDIATDAFAVRVMAGTAGDDVITTGIGNETISGGTGNDTINAGAGDDVLDGGAGNDTLIGGAGNDTLIGGAGADVFKWNLADVGVVGNAATDVIKDFQLGSGGDVLNLHDLLNGGSGVAHDPATLDQYLNFTEPTAGKVVIEVDPDGAGTGGVTQKISLEGITLVDLHSLTATGTFTGDQDIINKLIANGNLKTDA